MAKQYTVILDKKVVFGPTTDYGKLKAHLATLQPAVKAKCSVSVVDDKTAPAAVEPVQQPAPVKEQIKPAPVVAQPVQQSAPAATSNLKSVSDHDKVFTNYLEGSSNSELWKAKDGRNLIRILPVGGVLPSDWKTPFPFVITGVHPNVGLSLNDTVYCPRLTHGKACPICNFSWNLYNSKDENDKAFSKRIRAYKRILANIIDLNDIESGIQKFGFGKKLAEKILSYKSDPEYTVEGRDFLDPESGRNFVLIKKVVDGFPNYDDSRPEIKITPLSQFFPNWRAECHDLTKDMKTLTYDELMKILEDTKKAVLTTDPSDWGKSSRQNVASAPVVDNDLGVAIVEESVGDVAARLNNL